MNKLRIIFTNFLFQIFPAYANRIFYTNLVSFQINTTKNYFYFKYEKRILGFLYLKEKMQFA